MNIDTNEPEALDPSSLHSDNLPALLKTLNISIALTSYQTNRVMLVRSTGTSINIQFQEIPKPMGLALAGDRLVLGSWGQVLDYRRQDALIAQLPDADLVDACFVPRSSLVTGNINVHDIAWGDEDLWLVNTLFSCLATLNPNYNFVPRWQPHFIDALVAEDRCHLNGMAIRNGRPAYVTTFCQRNTPEAWRSFKAEGTVIDVASQRVLFDDLLMPHSPRWIDDWLYFCESGHGRVWRCRADGSERILVAELPGYTRGLAHIGSLLLIGVSQARDSSGAPALPLLDRAPTTACGFWIVDLDTLSETAWLLFTGNVQQIYDVLVLPNMSYPHLVAWSDDAMANSYCFPMMR